MIDLGLPEPLPTLIEKKYVEAEAEKTLVLAATQLAILKVAGLPVRGLVLYMELVSLNE